MKLRTNYTRTPHRNISTFYGTVHHDAKEYDRSWKNLYTSHSIEAIFGTPRRTVSTFYGTVHHDAKELDRSWEALCTTHSMEDVFGTPKRSPTEDVATPEDHK